MRKKKKQTRIIAVTSGKGGVGKTNVVANLAIALGKQNKKVLIFDADTGLGNIGKGKVVQLKDYDSKRKTMKRGL